VSLDTVSDGLPAGRRDDDPSDALVRQESGLEGLPQAVADEKASSILSLRPAIQALGKSGVRALVLRIFTDLIEGHYEEKRVAGLFGLSAATLTRFAGSRWRLAPGVRPPDLWTNVGRWLSSKVPLVEAAKEAGIWDDVQRTLQVAADADGEVRDV
jgi:hypothetical protein